MNSKQIINGNKRLIVKGIIWELLGIILLILMFGVIKTSILFVIFRIILYPIYHKIWKRSKWGK